MEEKQWFIYLTDHHEGPYTTEEIKSFIQSGKAQKNAYLWKEGFQDWLMMTEVADFGSNHPSEDGHGPSSFVFQPVNPNSNKDPKTDPKAMLWCLLSNQQYSGPYSIEQILEKLRARSCTEQDCIWKEGWTHFKAINEVEDFSLPLPEKTEPPVQMKLAQTHNVELERAPKKTESLGPKKKSRLVPLIAVLMAVGAFGGLIYSGKISPGNFQFDSAKVLAQLQGVKAKLILFLPSQVQKYVVSLDLPDDLNSDDAKELRSAALESLVHGPKAAIALPLNQERLPSFVVSSNVKDGTRLRVELRGKENTLVGATAYNQAAEVEVIKNIGRTIRFTYEASQPVPEGQYVASVLRTDTQEILTQKEVFLGGQAKDAAYAQRLKQYQESLQNQAATAQTEIRRIAITAETIANDSAARFFELNEKLEESLKTTKDPKKFAAALSGAKQKWENYHLDFERTVKSLDDFLNKSSLSTNPVQELLKTFLARSHELHKLESAFFSKDVATFKKTSTTSMEQIQKAAGKVLESLNALKAELAKP